VLAFEKKLLDDLFGMKNFFHILAQDLKTGNRFWRVVGILPSRYKKDESTTRQWSLSFEFDDVLGENN
jgi:hypothetical protein